MGSTGQAGEGMDRVQLPAGLHLAGTQGAFSCDPMVLCPHFECTYRDGKSQYAMRQLPAASVILLASLATAEAQVKWAVTGCCNLMAEAWWSGLEGSWRLGVTAHRTGTFLRLAEDPRTDGRWRANPPRGEAQLCARGARCL